VKPPQTFLQHPTKMWKSPKEGCFAGTSPLRFLTSRYLCVSYTHASAAACNANSLEFEIISMRFSFFSLKTMQSKIEGIAVLKTKVTKKRV